MPKKVKKVSKRVSARRKSSPTSSPRNTSAHGYLFIRRIVVISAFAAFFLTGLFAMLQSKAWYFFSTGKEQFVEYNSADTVAYYEKETFQVPPAELLTYNAQQGDEPKVLGDADVSNKRIEVDLANQRVYAFENGNKVYDFLVSTGLYGRTPTGEFTIERRVPIQTMKGGNKALGTYYYLPGVKFVQFFGNSSVPWWRGFSFHSTYWHSNFGHPMSHGCVNMTTADAETLWNWTGTTGVKVVIYGTAPAS